MKVNLESIIHLETDMGQTICQVIREKARCTQMHCEGCLFTVPDHVLTDTQKKLDVLNLVIPEENNS